MRPNYYLHLKQPLNNTEINELEKHYKTKLPDDLRALYKWKNGQNAQCFETFVNNSMFISLGDALETAREYTSMIGSDFEIENWWTENWIPIFHNGGGDYICYDSGGIFTGNPGQIIEFWHADNDRHVIAPNLETFISALNDYYSKTPAENFNGYFEVEPITNFPKKFVLE